MTNHDTLTFACDCGYTYGPGVQTDVLDSAKRHRAAHRDDRTAPARPAPAPAPAGEVRRG